ncbi:UNVERIFIED_CONTAM: Homeobox-leucine zipper protein HAT4 [Sesamum latifolium]|uniref:Homeobox-leucine zipper protein HAT4 n=1 Tax=Sesamum latifolium TaxID=2727402 RepID=A0AAW2XJV7_9LAMI
MEDENDEARLGLGLGLGSSECTPKRDHSRKKKRVFFLDLSIPLHPSDDHGTSADDDSSSSLKIMGDGNDQKQGCKNYGSFSCKDHQDEDSSNCSKDFSRKKLRLTRDQITLLEDSFRQHTTLNTAQKQTLAEKLNLKPRQVEVWFQNRRARTKLKQTEVDREFLKKNCERLSEENRRLKKELTELRSLLKIENPPAAAAPPPPFFHHNVKAAAAAPREKNGKGP